ncbi:MAG: 3-keto-disaccharide hydrolase [Planctomycetota bacterium]
MTCFRARRGLPAIVFTLSAAALLAGSLFSIHAAWAADADSAKPFLGNWALTIPGGGAGWLGVSEENGQLQASLLWGGGSVLPVASVKVDGDRLVLERGRPAPKQGKGPAGKETISATVDGDTMNLVLETSNPKGKATKKAEFKGEKLPPVPSAPNLAKVKFGEPIVLFNGKDLSGWKLTNPDQPSGWSVQDGVLMNRTPAHEEGKPRVRTGNLRTEQEFEDFRITLETRVPEGGNSGVYLRGIYEVQVSDSHGKPLDAHNMGGVYSRICPTVAAEKPAGEWQTMEITLVDRHITVVLNGQTIIDNQPVEGCTGGALWSDVGRPGPIFLQGDHTSVDYRNIAIRPVVK